MAKLQRKRTTRGPGASTAGAITRAFLSKGRFPFVLLGVFAVAAVTVWADRSIRAAVQTQLRGHLETIIETEVEALREWQKSQTTLARAVAGDPRVHAAMLPLLDPENATTPARAELGAALKARLEGLGHTEYMLLRRTKAGFRVCAAAREVWLGQTLDQGYALELGQRVLAAGEGQVSRPFRASLPRPDLNGELKVGLPHMAIVTPVSTSEGAAPTALLLLGIAPHQDFTRILQLARFGESGETYAFDAEGQLVSQSRFDAALRDLGLLTPDTGLTSILNVSVRDPGVDLTAGAKATVPRAEQPLTRAAKAAVAKEAGTDVGGYRDYRGVEVIGAWRWLDDMEIGIATEVDYAEAYAPLVRLRLAFGALVALLVAAGIGTLAFMFVAARSDVARRKAESEVESLGQYQLEEKLGQGGMGAVYRAKHSLLRRPTAVKILEAGDNGPEAIARFEREVQATARLVNPHTIRIYDYGHTAEGKFFYAMEFLDGLTLGDLLEVHGGPLPPGRAVYLLSQICESLAEAHAQGLVHRDVKPDNILVCARGGRYDDIKVLDFGLVKELDEAHTEDLTLTQAGQIMGTPLYMPPEQVTSGKICPSADIYAVGGLAYHLLAGVPPFFAKSVMQILTMHVTQPVPPLSERRGEELPAGLEELVLACLAKEPEARPADAGVLLERLRETKLAAEWTQADAKAWWEAKAQAVEAPPQVASKDPTGLSWLNASGPDAAAAITATVDLPPPDAPGS